MWMERGRNEEFFAKKNFKSFKLNFIFADFFWLIAWNRLENETLKNG
jgi:hypothetical protein